MLVGYLVVIVIIIIVIAMNPDYPIIRGSNKLGGFHFFFVAAAKVKTTGAKSPRAKLPILNSYY